jgi:hydroxymethylglutaryl-CoA lyase
MTVWSGVRARGSFRHSGESEKQTREGARTRASRFPQAHPNRKREVAEGSPEARQKVAPGPRESGSLITPANSWPAAVRIVEVGPRDGLQNETSPVPVSTRVQFVEMLAAAGLRSIECGSFVSPRWVPQMVDSAEVFQKITRLPGTCYTGLVPNVRGFRSAVEAGADEVAVFVSASEAFSKANLNCSIDESLRKAEEVLAAAKEVKMPVRGYVSCVLGCPFQGQVTPAEVVGVAKRLHALGCYEISLGDTIGVGTPLKARQMISAVAQTIPIGKLALHYHDTWGQALANILVSLELGVNVIDSSVAGLGGCPYAPGAAGNVATEDVLYMLDGMGISTGVNLKLLAAAGRMICQALGREPSSKAAQALLSATGNLP